MTQFAVFQAATRVILGEGVTQQTGALLRENGVQKALIVSDKGIVNAGIVDRVRESLDSAGIAWALFDAVEPDPAIETVSAGVELYRSTGCNGLVAIGGGSPMDAAKGIGVLAANPGSLSDYFGIGKVANPLPALFAIPTTVGTGSEVTTFAVISDRSENKKMVIGSERVAPRMALLDPDLVANLPAELVAATGLDALAHAIESVISVFATPFTDAVGLEAIYQVSHNLLNAMDLGGRKSRANLLYASTMAGQAFSFARTGLAHGMAHPVGSYYHIHHGLVVAILLPYVLEFNKTFCENKLRRVAATMGEQADPRAAIEAVNRLKTAAGIPDKLGGVGVTKEHLDKMARDAHQSGNAQLVNPRKPTLEEVQALYLQAI